MLRWLHRLLADRDRYTALQGTTLGVTAVYMYAAKNDPVWAGVFLVLAFCWLTDVRTDDPTTEGEL